MFLLLQFQTTEMHFIKSKYKLERTLNYREHRELFLNLQ